MDNSVREGLETIFRYTGETRHPNGVWDAHVIAGRLLRGEDQNGRLPQQSNVATEPKQSTYGLCSRCGRPLLHGHINACLGRF